MLADGRVLALRPHLLAAIEEAAREVCGGAFGEFFDGTMRGVLVEAFERAGAHEGTVWLLDAERTALIPRFNSGPQAAQFVGTFRQSLRAGMIAMVAATEQPVCENEVCFNARQDRTLDERLNVRTWAMIAVPLHFAGGLRGVISCVKIAGDGPPPPGFTASHLGGMQRAAAVISRLMEHRLFALCLGLEEAAG